MDKTFKILALTEDTKLLNSLESYFKEWGYEGFFSNSLEADISEITKISPDAIVVDVSSCEKNQLGICEFLKKDFATTYIPIIALICQQRACHELLGLTVGIDDYIVVPLDPVELRIRIEMAVKRTARSFYASPLTGLPGGKIVEEMMKERIDSRKSFVVGHADIDNFKAYNDKYGYLMGDRVIMQTAYMLSGAVRKWGTPHDFVGHIGGDDFVFLTTPEKYDTICQNFICMFDTITPFLYKEEDRKLGYVEAKGRTNRITKLPLVSMTIALVLNPRFGEIDNVISLNEKIAEINQKYRNRMGPTNVIAFSMREGEFSGINPELLGDVVISLETVEKEANAAGIDFETRFFELLAHGVLHLFGYDHEASDAMHEKMERKTDEILKKINL